MRVLSLCQPWAQLCVTPVPGLGCAPGEIRRVGGVVPMVKTIETRSWPAPAGLVGQRIALHATARASRRWPGSIWKPPTAVALPLGAVVGSAVLAACVPIVEGAEHSGFEHLAVQHGELWHCVPPDHLRRYRSLNVADQLPFGDFRPGRWAWLLADAEPTTERCPWCWGSGDDPASSWDIIDERPVDEDLRLPCGVCDGEGRCAPIPAKGRQRVWEWTP